MTQHYSDTEAPTCECGRVTGHLCDWQGEVGELVTIEWMPIGLRASHAAAGNSGRWPHNGADRLRVCRECADSLVAGNDGWASEVRPVGAPCPKRQVTMTTNETNEHESIRMAYRAVSIAEYRHKAVASLLEAFEPNPPQWARDAVRAAWDDVLAARAAEARMMEEG